MTHDVFISYSNQDKHIALAICARLEADQIRCWMAPRDVPVGKSWPAAILDGIDQCRVMVLVLSSASNASQDVAREVVSAAQSGKMILPFKIDDVVPRKELDYFLKNVHWLDAVTPPLAAHIEALAVQVRAALEASGQSAARNPGSPTTPSLPSAEREGASASSASLPKRWPTIAAIAVTIAVVAIGSVYSVREEANKSSADASPRAIRYSDLMSKVDAVMAQVVAAETAREQATKDGDKEAYARAIQAMISRIAEGLALLDRFDEAFPQDPEAARKRIELLLKDGWTNTNGESTSRSHGLARLREAFTYASNPWVREYDRRWANFELARTAFNHGVSADVRAPIEYLKRTIDSADADWLRLHSRMMLGKYAEQFESNNKEARRHYELVIKDANAAAGKPWLSAEDATKIRNEYQQRLDGLSN